jgi:ABC-type phosphate transport system substrate-binding protein
MNLENLGIPGAGSVVRLLTALAVLSLPSVALGAPCEGIGNSVTLVGSSAVQPLIARLGQILAAQDAEEAKLFYNGSGSCAGVQAMLSPSGFRPTKLTQWLADGTEVECDVPSGQRLDGMIGMSDVFPSTCIDLPNGLPSTLADFHGPVQTMAFLVPRVSSEYTISAEAAYYVFGFGANSGVSPWVDETATFHRGEESGTQRLIAQAIGVPPSRFRGIAAESSGDLVERLTAVAAEQTNSAIGFASSSVADSRRSTLRTLAFQNFGGTCALLPDRFASSREKYNVRRGAYPLWGPLHLLVAVNEDRQPLTSLSELILSFLLGTRSPAPGINVLELTAEANLIPQCAMRVSRQQEMGPATPFTPPQPCGCHFEQVTNGSNTCTSCASNRDCAAPSFCSWGYCEGESLASRR